MGGSGGESSGGRIEVSRSAVARAASSTGASAPAIIRRSVSSSSVICGYSSVQYRSSWVGWAASGVLGAVIGPPGAAVGGLAWSLRR